MGAESTFFNCSAISHLFCTKPLGLMLTTIQSYSIYRNRLRGAAFPFLRLKVCVRLICNLSVLHQLISIRSICCRLHRRGGLNGCLLVEGEEGMRRRGICPLLNHY